MTVRIGLVDAVHERLRDHNLQSDSSAPAQTFSRYDVRRTESAFPGSLVAEAINYPTNSNSPHMIQCPAHLRYHSTINVRAHPPFEQRHQQSQAMYQEPAHVLSIARSRYREVRSNLAFCSPSLERNVLSPSPNSSKMIPHTHSRHAEVISRHGMQMIRRRIGLGSWPGGAPATLIICAVQIGLVANVRVLRLISIGRRILLGAEDECQYHNRRLLEVARNSLQVNA